MLRILQPAKKSENKTLLDVSRQINSLIRRVTFPKVYQLCAVVQVIGSQKESEEKLDLIRLSLQKYSQQLPPESPKKELVQMDIAQTSPSHYRNRTAEQSAVCGFTSPTRGFDSPTSA